MDDQATLSAVPTEVDPAGGAPQNVLALAANGVGIAGLVLVLGVLALTAVAFITASTTPDFMSSQDSDDPFFTAGAACLLPPLFGVPGFICAIGALKAVSVSGKRAMAIRGLVFGILNVLLPIAIGIVVFTVDQSLASSCGGG